MTTPSYPPKPSPGDRIAVVSPSSGLPGLFPRPFAGRPPRRTRRRLSWADPATFDAEPETRPGTGWTWVNADRVVQGRSWGGCLEILGWLLSSAPCGSHRDERPSPGCWGHQREAVLRDMRGTVRVDGPARRITVTY